jgi:hypothetical protein
MPFAAGTCQISLEYYRRSSPSRVTVISLSWQHFGTFRLSFHRVWEPPKELPENWHCFYDKNIANEKARTGIHNRRL